MFRSVTLLLTCCALFACNANLRSGPAAECPVAHAATTEGAGVRPTDAAPPPRAGSLTEVRRTLLAQHPIDGLPGLESRIYLIEFPPGAESKLHLHTTPGVGYVLEGSFESAFGDEPPVVKRAGDAFVDLANQPHHFKNADARRPLRFVVAGTFHMDEPLFTVLPNP